MPPIPPKATLKQFHALLHSNFTTLGHIYKILHIAPVYRKKVQNVLVDELEEDDMEEWFQSYQQEHQEEILKAQQEELKLLQEEQKKEVLRTNGMLASKGVSSHDSNTQPLRVYSTLPFNASVPHFPQEPEKKLTKLQMRKFKKEYDWNVRMFNLLKYHFPEQDEVLILDMLNKKPNWESKEFRQWYFDNILLKSFPEAKSMAELLQGMSVTALNRSFSTQKLLSYYDNSILQMFDDLMPRHEEFHFHPQDLPVGMVPGMEIEDVATVQRKQDAARAQNQFKLPRNSWVFADDFSLRTMRPAEWDKYLVEIIARAEKALKMKTVTEWVRIGKSDAESIGLGRFASVEARLKMLKKVHPEVDWNKRMFAASTKSNQRWVYRAVEEIFPTLSVVEEKQMELEAHGGKSLFEADVYVEELKLAFEYQGEQHYHDIKAFFAPIEGQLRRDQLKHDAFSIHGITLIEVPYWWDKSVDSLKASINRIRPELVEKPANVDPIPLEPINMPKFVKKAAAMEPSSWDGRKDLTGWYWCEKYDGIRCISEEGKFFSKKGNEIIFPDWLAERILPYIQDVKYPIDSELTCSQGYELMTTLVRLARNFTFEDREWMQVKLQIFDMVDTTGTMTFDERQESLKEWYASLPEEAKQHLSLVQYERIESNAHLRAELDKVSMDQGGEGLIAVAPDNLYQPGRSRNSLKIKKYYDMEALYLGKAPNAVAFEIELINGERCQARCSYSDYYRNNYVQGQTVLTITYTHLHQSTGKPFKPMVLRERLDLSWGDIKDHYSRVQPDYIELHSTARTPPSMEEVIAQSTFVNTMKTLLKDVSKPTSELSDEEIRSLVGEMMMRDPTGQYPTSDEKKGLYDLLGIQEGRLNQMIADARYHEAPGANVNEARRRIKEVMSSQDNNPPSRKQLEEISQSTQITTYRLNLIVNEILDPPGEVTEEKKNAIWQFVKQTKPFQLISYSDLEKLHKKTKMSVSQVRRIIWLMRDRPGTLSDASKHVVQEFIREQGEDNAEWEPSDEQLAELAETTKLNRMQIHILINSLRKPETAPVEKANLAALTKWLESRDFQMPNDLELSQLEHQTGLDRDKLIQEVESLIKTHGTMNKEKKEVVLQWMIQNDFAIPDEEQLTQLQEETNLTVSQVKQLVEAFRSPPGRIEAMSLVKLEELLHSDESRETIIDKIQASTGLGLRQVRLLVAYAREGPGDMNADKKEQLEEKLRPVEKLSASLLDELSSEFSLNRFQVYKIHRMLHEEEHSISEEVRERVRQWLEANEDLTEFSASELDELKSEVNLSDKEIYDIVSNLSDLPGEMTPETKNKVLEWMSENVKEQIE